MQLGEISLTTKSHSQTTIIISVYIEYRKGAFNLKAQTCQWREVENIFNVETRESVVGYWRRLIEFEAVNVINKISCLLSATFDCDDPAMEVAATFNFRVCRLAAADLVGCHPRARAPAPRNNDRWSLSIAAVDFHLAAAEAGKNPICRRRVVGEWI